MKKFLILFLLTFSQYVYASFIKDVAESPASFGQYRMVFSETKDVGIYGTINDQEHLSAMAYGVGSFDIRGLNECGYYYGTGTQGYVYYGFYLSMLPDFDICIYELTFRGNEFDAPGLGRLLVRKFNDPDITPLITTMNGITRKGINWVQVREDSDLKVGITEDRRISLFPSGKSGKIIFTGCGISNEVYSFKNIMEWKTTIDNIYKTIGGVKKSCLFNILVNNDDFNKESSTILISVYKSGATFLAAPLVTKDGSDLCFEFKDKYVVRMAINDKYVDSNKMCVKKTNQYIVNGVTSKLRTFYGIYNGTTWILMR